MADRLLELSRNNGINSPKKKSTACRRCHTRKIRCSGGTPCDTCKAAKRPDECVYVSRNRKVKVPESYLQQVLLENERLKSSKNSSSSNSAAGTPTEEIAEEQPSGIDATVVNPLMRDRAWFISYDAENPPIYVGEAACAAFATRFRQAIDVSEGTASAAHFPRTHFTTDNDLNAASTARPEWPSRARARLLVQVALSHVGRSYYVGLTSKTLAKLEAAYENPAFVDSATTCKLFILFAMGEVYSRKTKGAEQGIPGMSFFLYANSLLSILPERANLEHIESLLLLSFFSYNLNRRTSAYLLIGDAIRLSMCLGLHHNLNRSTVISPVARQHRIRLWWTIYICDRMWGSKLGQAPCVRDDDITVDLPSMVGLNGDDAKEFPDPDYILARISLAKITGNIIRNIYSRGKPPPFVQSVNQVLRDLNLWMATLPDSVRLGVGRRSPERPILSLHLSFNQSVILATRPVLLYVFEQKRKRSPSADNNVASDFTTITSTLAEACIHAARHSSELLLQGWIEGILSTFGYFDAQYLFSSATVLAISSISDGGQQDQEKVESAAHLLESMADSGNLAAAEFSLHLNHVRNAIERYRSSVAGERPTSPLLPTTATANSTQNNMMGPLTTEMALLEPPLQDFLSLSDFTFDFPNVVDQFDNMSPLYTWPQ